MNTRQAYGYFESANYPRNTASFFNLSFKTNAQVNSEACDSTIMKDFLPRDPCT